MDPVDTHRHIKRMHVYILILTVAVLALVWYFFRGQVPKKEEVPAPTSSLIQKENKGEMSLQTQSRTVRVGSPFVVQVVSNSEEEDVVGFDVLLGFDQDAFTVGAVTSPLSGYRVVSTPQGDHLSVTAVQDPQDTTRNVFKDKVILEVTLTPKTAGNYDFSILQTAGAETSKLVNTDTSVLFPKVESLSVSVE